MIVVQGFSGEIPKIIPRLLPDSAAQVARNCKLLDGAIVPIRYPADFRTLAPGNVMFFKRGDQWFEWSKIVDVAPAPVAQNRLYVTGDGAPKIVVDSSTVYPLSVQSPADALTAAVTGTPDPATQETVIYTYTYVTAYDEESKPAPASNQVLRSYGMDVTLTGFEAPPTDRNYNRIRIYRSQTSASGATDFYFIAEVNLPVPYPNFIDVVENNPIQEAIPSLSYDPPPDDLAGIVAHPNGFMVGFSGNKLYFSEPWLPHAWPQKYVLTTNFDIVGVGIFGHSIAVLTEGNPYVATGVSPDAMVMERIEVNYPCVNKQSIVDLGYSVAYASSDGLAVISSSGAALVSRNLFTRDEWRHLSPETFFSAQFDGRYVAAYSYVDLSGATKQGTLLIDLTREQPFLSRVDLHADYMFFEIGAGKLYLLNGRIAAEWDEQHQKYMTATWRSKKFVVPAHVNFGAFRADATALASGYPTDDSLPRASISDASLVSALYDTTDNNGMSSPAPAGAPVGFQATVYADGVERTVVSKVNDVARLKGGFTALQWEVEVKSEMSVEAFGLAYAPSEFVGGLS